MPHRVQRQDRGDHKRTASAWTPCGRCTLAPRVTQLCNSREAHTWLNGSRRSAADVHVTSYGAASLPVCRWGQSTTWLRAVGAAGPLGCSSCGSSLHGGWRGLQGGQNLVVSVTSGCGSQQALEAAGHTGVGGCAPACRRARHACCSTEREGTHVPASPSGPCSDTACMPASKHRQTM